MGRGTLAVRAPNWVGDLVMATPTIEAALADGRWDDVRIVLRAHLAPVLAGGPAEDRLVRIGSDREEVEAYRRIGPAAVLLLTNSFGAAWRAWRARIPVRAGTALSGRGLLLTHAAVPPAKDGRRLPSPTAGLQRAAAALLGIEVRQIHPRLYARESVRADVAATLARLGLPPGAPYALGCPGAAFGAAKLWPAERFAAVLDELHRLRGWRAVLTGGPGEEGLIAAVADACRHPAISLAGAARDFEGLEGLKALVAGAQILLVGDSGPRWFAAAFDVPCVSVMGPNFPEVTASSLELAAIVRVDGLECSPCLRKTCPLDHHRCMLDLAPERVLAAAREVLARRRSAELLR